MGLAKNSAHVTASKLLSQAKVAQAVAARHREVLNKIGLTQDVILEAMRRVIVGDIRDLFNDDGNLKPIKSLSAEAASLIAGVEVIIKNAQAGDGHTDLVHKVRLKDASRYVEMAAKHFGMLTDHVKVTPGELTIVEKRLNAARDRLAAAGRPCLPLDDLAVGGTVS